MSPATNLDPPISVSDLYQRQQVGIGAPSRRSRVSARREDPGGVMTPPRPHLDPSSFDQQDSNNEPQITTAPVPDASSVEPQLAEPQFAETPTSTAPATTDVMDRSSSAKRIVISGTSSELLEGFQAQWEVDRFAWPHVCEKLVKSCHPGLSDILRRLARLSARGQKVFAITSHATGEGCSTLAMCLARMAAADGQQVALVDGNLDRPTLSRDLGISFSSGWQDHSTQLPISETAVYSLDDRLNVLPISCRVETIDQHIQDRGLDVIQSLTDTCDLVLIDGGPMFMAARQWFSATAGDAIDGALVIRDLRSTVTEQVDDVCFRINQSGIQELAVIENFQPT